MKNKLTPIPGQILPSRGSKKLVYFNCSCGNKGVRKIWRYYYSGQIKTCGRCNVLSIEYWKNAKFGKLRLKIPEELYKRTHTKKTWICDCGNEIQLDVSKVTTGQRTSCGRCNVLSIEYWKNTKFGKLRLKIPRELHKGSGKKTTWVCDCGNEIYTQIYLVTSGQTTTCGRCNVLSIEYWKNAKFGKLKLRTPRELHKGSQEKLVWVCDCGQKLESRVFDVTHGRTKSCGSCHEIANRWYELNKETILKLKTPINIEQFPAGLITPLETIHNTNKPFKAKCFFCQQIYFPRWNGIRHRESLSCGCTSNVISYEQRRIANFLRKLGVKIKLEHKIGKFKYDIFVPEHNLLIEFNGLYWHSGLAKKIKDREKYRVAMKYGYEYVCIFEDEWMLKTNQIKSILINKVGKGQTTSLRPSKCKIITIKSKEADELYLKYHYIGPCKSSINYGVYFNGKLISCASFKRPTRQSRYDWELVRVVSHPSYRVHGIWGKIINKFIADHIPNSIVTFSDNRFFHGSMYKKIGFTFDEEIPQDYYWCKGQKRYHKSGLRKKKDEDKSKTETQLRESQGYYRIWDLGKKRWVMQCHPPDSMLKSQSRN